MAGLRRATDSVLAEVDVLLLPTAGTVYETTAVAAEPLRLTRNLGHYTSFVNLLDLAAIALPAGFGNNALPFGISLIAPAFRDIALLDLGLGFSRSPVCRAALRTPSEAVDRHLAYFLCDASDFL